MNARRLNRWIVALLLVVTALVAGFAPNVNAQGTTGSTLAVQFFDTIAGATPGYALDANAVLHTPDGDYAGLAGMDEYRASLAASFSNLQFSLQNAAQAGNLVIASFTMTGINTGAYAGLAANCAAISIPGVAMLRLTDGSVAEQWISYDTDLIASQIGAFNQIDASSRPGCA
jgi:predicted ester cyclase